MFSIWVKDFFSDDYIKLDLNDYQKVLIKVQMNNIEKLSNVFNDVTNSFTIPSTPKNDAALRYYYDRDIVSNYNPNINIPAYVEVGSIPYKWGVLKVEGGSKVMNIAKNYKVSFFSKSTQLNDLFGNDVLSQLDYDKTGLKVWDNLSQYEFLDNSTNFFNSVSNNFMDGNIITPLIINSNRDIEWGSNNIFDISKSSSALKNSEVYYALKINNIIKGIQDKYDITFNGTFFEEEHFNRLFLLLNSKNNTGTSNITLMDFTTGHLDDIDFDYGTDTWNYSINVESVKPRYIIYVYPDVDNVPYSIIVKKGDEIVTRLECDGGDFTSSVINVPYENGLYTTGYQFYIQSDYSLTYSFKLLLRLTVFGNYDRTGEGTGSITSLYKIENKIPKMKVVDFLQGIMKMFKLIIRPTSEKDFYIDTLDNYYTLGNIINMNKYVNIKETDYSSPELYSNIRFKYLKTECVLGKKFRQLYDPINDEIGYGDLKADYIIDSKKELKIELPFENMLFERLITSTSSIYPLETTDILIGQLSSLEDDNSTLTLNDSGPILFYNNGTQSTGTFSICLQHVTATSSTNIVYNCGNTDNTDINLVTNSLNWGIEVDPWHQQKVSKCLYFNYWSRWISSIYDLRQMKFTYKAYLPMRYIYEIDLNDILIIGDKRFKIESMTIDLTSGESTFELFIDTDIYLGLPTDL